MALKVVEEWFNACAGCEVSILNIGENLVDLLSELEFVHMPFLIDHKYYGQTGEGTQLEIPEADVAIVSGGVRTEEQKEILQFPSPEELWIRLSEYKEWDEQVAGKVLHRHNQDNLLLNTFYQPFFVRILISNPSYVIFHLSQNE